MKHFILTLMLAASLLGCERAPQPITAPVIHFGQDMCAVCSMIISDERFAGAIGLRRDGRVTHLLFDDVGEMLEHVPEDYEAIRWFATDASTRAWLDAEEAFFLRSDDLMTPMGYGVGAYASREAATEARKTWGGELLTFRDLVGEGGAPPRDD